LFSFSFIQTFRPVVVNWFYFSSDTESACYFTITCWWFGSLNYPVKWNRKNFCHILKRNVRLDNKENRIRILHNLLFRFSFNKCHISFCERFQCFQPFAKTIFIFLKYSRSFTNVLEIIRNNPLENETRLEFYYISWFSVS